VYAVPSRRNPGISVGINLNPDKVCSFDCVYCQVDRATPPGTRDVCPALVLEELQAMIELVVSGAIYDQEAFAGVPERLKRLNDIAFSGDGEPTSSTYFGRIVRGVTAMKRRRGLERAKLVIMTNASVLHRPEIQRALTVLDDNQGEIWAKLDAGTDAHYREIDRTTIPFERILTNLQETARRRSLLIQSLFSQTRSRGLTTRKSQRIAVASTTSWMPVGGSTEFRSTQSRGHRPKPARARSTSGGWSDRPQQFACVWGCRWRHSEAQQARAEGSLYESRRTGI
jgi:hypothetical protein